MSKILLLETEYFGYQEIIKNELESLNHQVTWMDDRPSTNLLSKAILRVKPSLMKKKVDKYFYKKIIPIAEKEKFDIVLVVLGQSFTKEMFFDLRKRLPDAKFILYLWDSVKNFPSFEDLSKAFDVTISFDRNDCKEYGFKYLPLFYNQKCINDNVESVDYDFSFVGTVKRGKINYLKAIRQQLESKYNCYFHLYLQSRLVFLFYKLFDKDFKCCNMSDFKYKKLSYAENVDLCKKSKVIIDVTMSHQNGLSMRTIECLGYKRKLITNNPDIVNYDFYRPENVYVFDGEFNFDDIFFHSDYIPVDESIRENYSIDSWVRQILQNGK